MDDSAGFRDGVAAASGRRLLLLDGMGFVSSEVQRQANEQGWSYVVLLRRGSDGHNSSSSSVAPLPARGGRRDAAGRAGARGG